MASLLRQRQLSFLHRVVLNQLVRSRNISTSKKNRDTVAAACDVKPATAKEEENWVSYGFDFNSKEEDTNVHNASFFFSVTLCVVFGSFAWTYAPDVRGRDWAQREAFLELRRRELAGEPPISPNYVHPSTIVLPSDEELASVELII